MQRRTFLYQSHPLRAACCLLPAACCLLAATVALAQGPRVVVALEQPIKLSDYWIGLECYPVSDALRSQLNLPEGQGLLVEQVVEGSPAEKAGLQKHDVLVKAADKPLGGIQDLIDAVDAAKQNKFTLELLRGGKSMKVAVTPAKRPEEAAGGRRGPRPSDFDWNAMRDWIEKFRPGEEGRPPLRFRFFGPGAILRHLPFGALSADLPDNMTIVVTKEGDKPAKITVTKDDEKWEITEDELDKLPEDVRSHVKRLLGRSLGAPAGESALRFDELQFDFLPDWQWRGEPPGVPEVIPKGRPEGWMEKRLEEIWRQLEELRKSIDQLRENRPRPKGPEAKEKNV